MHAAAASLVSFGAWFALLAGCSSYAVDARAPATDAFGAPPAGLGRVCVFRPHAIGSLLTTPYHDNGALVGATKGPAYFCYFAAPGRHELRVDTSDAPPLRFEVAQGERVWVHHQINVGTDELFFLDEPHARRFAETCTYQVVTETPSDERVPLEVPLARAQ